QGNCLINRAERYRHDRISPEIVEGGSLLRIYEPRVTRTHFGMKLWAKHHLVAQF
ncbi:unnamed protein product, partial [Rhizoctonia solani]